MFIRHTFDIRTTLGYPPNQYCHSTCCNELGRLSLEWIFDWRFLNNVKTGWEFIMTVYLEDRVAKLENQYGQIETWLTKLAGSFVKLTKRFETRLDALDQKVDHLDQKVDHLDQKVDRVLEILVSRQK